jgi:hypothetical protein
MPYFTNKPAPSAGSSLPLPSSVAKKEQERPNKRKLLESDSNLFAKKLVF